MGSDCVGVWDAIWDFASDGIELTGEVLRHARLCGTCSNQADWQEICR